MKLYNIPKNTKLVIFDIDGTLYTNDEYVFEQVDIQVRHYAHLNNISEEKARTMMNEYRSKWSKEHDGKKISLGNAFTAFGVDINTSIKWRNSLFKPELYLKKDEKLRETLIQLKDKGIKMTCITNNPVEAASKTLKVIGIDDILTDIIGLDTCCKSKPAIEMLELAMKKSNCKPNECVSIGDRYDIDLSLPLEIGMGGIEIKGVEELYNLADILNN